MASSRVVARRFAAALLLGTAGLYAASGIERVPADSIAIGRARVAGPGWRYAPPWDGLRVVARSGSVDVGPVRVAAAPGPEIALRASITYAVGDGLSPELRATAHDRGLDDALAERIGAAMAAVDAGRVSDLLDLAEREVRADLEAAGLRLDSVEASFDGEDAELVRRHTRRARSLARPAPGRLLLVGLDGADWELIDPMIRAGSLPHLARLVAEGARAPLRSYDPMYSPLLWNTVMTGKSPDRHGVADFLVVDADTGQRRPITSDYRRVKALWNVLSDLGQAAGWLSWWATYPAEPVAPGVVVSELVPHTLVSGGTAAVLATSGLAWPGDYLATREELLVPPSAIRLEDVRALFPIEEDEFLDARSRAPGEEPVEGGAEPADPAVFAIKLLSATHTYQNLALAMLRDGLPVVAVYYEGIDMMGHRFQHYMPPKMALVTDEEFARFRDAVPAYYRLQDALIGELVEHAGPGATTVIVSDHGFRSGARRPRNLAPYTHGQPAEWHRPWGVLLLHGPPFRHARLSPCSLYDVAPTVLYLRGLPLADDMPGLLVRQAFEESVLEDAPPARIATYELVGPPRRPPAETTVDAAAMEQMMANLRALGYVGGEAQPGTAPIAPGGGDASTQAFYHRNLATYHIKRGDLARARQELLLANERHPMPKTYALLSRVLAEQGRFAEAADVLDDGLRRVEHEMSPESLLWVVEMRLQAGDAGAARDAPRRWQAVATPAVRDAVDGRLAEHDGDVARARRLYERALDADPLLTSIADRLLRLYEAAGEPERIRPFLERGIAATAEGVDVYHARLGDLARRRGDMAAAESHYQHAVDLVPDDGVWLGHLAIAQAALGKSEAARRTIDWALRGEPREVEAWMALGSALDRLGETRRAVSAFARAGELGAPEPQVELATVLALYRAGLVDEALERLASARRRLPADPALADLARRIAPGPGPPP